MLPLAGRRYNGILVLQLFVYILLIMTSVLLNDNPDIIVATPTRLHALLQSKAVNLAHLSFLAIDEADLLLSYGHKDDLTRIMDPSTGWVPRLGVQGCLMSATLGEDVQGVKGLVLRDPVGLYRRDVLLL